MLHLVNSVYLLMCVHLECASYRVHLWQLNVEILQQWMKCADHLTVIDAFSQMSLESCVEADSIQGKISIKTPIVRCLGGCKVLGAAFWERLPHLMHLPRSGLLAPSTLYEFFEWSRSLFRCYFQCCVAAVDSVFLLRCI